MSKSIFTETVSANSCSTMETRDHAKNGVSPKDQMSRENFLNFSKMKKIVVMLVVFIGFGIGAMAQNTTCTIYNSYGTNVLGEVSVDAKQDSQGYYCLVYSNTSDKTVTISVRIKGDVNSSEYCTQTITCYSTTYNSNVGRLDCYSVNPYFQKPVLNIPYSKNL